MKDMAEETVPTLPTLGLEAALAGLAVMVAGAWSRHMSNWREHTAYPNQHIFAFRSILRLFYWSPVS